MICEKTSYPTKKQASDAAIGLSRRSKFKYYAYHCDDCGQYHFATINKHTLHKPVKGRGSKFTMAEFLKSLNKAS